MDEHISAIIFTTILFMTLFMGMIGYDFNMKLTYVDNQSFAFTQASAKLGRVSDELLNDYFMKLHKCGEFEANVVAKRFNEDGTVDVLKNGDLFNVDLREENYSELTVDVVYLKNHPFNYFLTHTFLGTPTGIETDLKLVGTSTSFIE